MKTMNKRKELTTALLQIIQSGQCDEQYVDIIYDAIEYINSRLEEENNSNAYVCLDDVLMFPIRRDHHDNINGNQHFINGIETVIEYILALPRYKIVTTAKGESSCAI